MLLACKSGCFATQKGLFYRAKEPILQCKTGPIATL